MQGSAPLSPRKKTILLVSVVLAVVAMVLAPEGAVTRAAIVLAGKTQESALVLQPPQALPEGLAYQDESGSPQTLSGLKGKVVVMNFWALWCESCKAEKPKLNQLQADYAGKGLVVLTLSDPSDTLEMAGNYYKNKQLNALKPARDENGQLFRTFGLKGVPTSLVLNKRGELVALHQGALEWSDPAVRKVLDALLAE